MDKRSYGQTDRQTLGHRIYRASIASRDKCFLPLELVSFAYVSKSLHYNLNLAFSIVIFPIKIFSAGDHSSNLGLSFDKRRSVCLNLNYTSTDS